MADTKFANFCDASQSRRRVETRKEVQDEAVESKNGVIFVKTAERKSRPE
jgi:hypothetical protein